MGCTSPKPIDFGTSIGGLTALVELDIKGGGIRPRAFRVPQRSGQPHEDPLFSSSA